MIGTHALLSNSKNRKSGQDFILWLPRQVPCHEAMYELPPISAHCRNSRKTSLRQLTCIATPLLILSDIQHITNFTISSSSPIFQSGHCLLHRREDPDAKTVAARDQRPMEVMARLQIALGTSKLGYTGLNCAYGLELIDAQVHALWWWPVFAWIFFASGSLETFT